MREGINLSNYKRKSKEKAIINDTTMGLLFRCAGPLPRSLAVPPSAHVALTLVGCVVHARTGAATLLIAHDWIGGNRSVCTMFAPAHLRCERGALVGELRVEVGGSTCEPLRAMAHVASTQCHHIATTTRVDGRTAISVRVVGSVATASSVVVPLVTAPQLSRFVACTPTALFGRDNEARRRQLDLFAAARSAWRDLEFNSSQVFARSEAGCEALRAAPPAGSGSVACEVRRRWPLARGVRVRVEQRTPYFDQGVHVALCLLYARHEGAQWLALTDHDETPPRDLWRALRLSTEASMEPTRATAVAQRKPPVGVKLFFDADGDCHRAFAARSGPSAHDRGGRASPPPPWSGCPCSEEEFVHRCRPQRRKSHQRTHWKPILVPSRAHDASVHWVSRAAGFGRALAVHCPCYRHTIDPVTSRRGLLLPLEHWPDAVAPPRL